MAQQKKIDMFLPAEQDPRENGTSLGDERATLVEYLRCQRLTLELKCAGLDAEQLARRSVPPSTLTLLGLIRHMAEVERAWFRRVLSGLDAPRRYSPEGEFDHDIDDAVADPACVEEAWAAWREEVAFAEQYLRDHDDMGQTAVMRNGESISFREVLVHMVEEYARHNGHAELLRECIDGRVGQ
jgi:uncharacterized damage-inducible protein DinB